MPLRFRFAPLHLPLLAAASLLGLLPSLAAAPSPAPDTGLYADVRETDLPNGLRVLTREISTSPVVGIAVTYGAGAREEADDQPQIAHLVEHLAFRGTEHYPGTTLAQALERNGAEMNAQTQNDCAAYYATVPADRLELVLRLEADRMRSCHMDPADVERERRIVMTEMEPKTTTPEARLTRAMLRAAFPGRKTGRLGIYTAEDVNSVTPAQVRRFYDEHYGPNNATLSIVGHFSTDQALALVRRYFGTLPRIQTTPTPEFRVGAGVLEKSEVHGPGTAPLVALAFPAPDPGTPDDDALDLIRGALDVGSNSLFNEALVSSRYARWAHTRTPSYTRPARVALWAAAAPGIPLERVEGTLRKLVERIQRNGISGVALQRARALIEARRLASQEDVGSQARQLGFMSVAHGNWRISSHYFEHLRAVTPDDIRRVANQYLKLNAAQVGWYLPTAPAGPAAGPAVASAREVPEVGGLPGALPAEALLPPPPAPSLEVERFTLPNGVTVVVQPDHTMPTVTMQASLPVGSLDDPPGRPGLAQLTATMMGTTNLLEGFQVQAQLEAVGAHFHMGASLDDTSATGWARREDAPLLLELFATALREPRFSEQDLNWFGDRIRVQVEEQARQIQNAAMTSFGHNVYPPGHPLRRPNREELLASLARITTDDVRRFYLTHYGPRGLVIVLVGDIDPVVARRTLFRKLSDWHGPAAPPTKVPLAALPDQIRRLSVSFPGGSSAAVVWGHPMSVRRGGPDYYAADLLESALGNGLATSRLMRVLRGERGLTYSLADGRDLDRLPSAFWIAMDVDPGVAGEAARVLDAELRRVCKDGLTAAERDDAVANLAASYVVQLGTPSGRAALLLDAAQSGEGADALPRYVERVSAVTLEQLNAAARRLLHPDQATVVIVGGRNSPAARPVPGKKPEPVTPTRRAALPVGTSSARPVGRK